MLRLRMIAVICAITIVGVVSVVRGQGMSQPQVRGNRLVVLVDAPDGAYIGCSIWTSTGRIDLEEQFVVGRDTVSFVIPEGATYGEVAMWRDRFDYGSGPDPDNPWAKKNGFYLWGELARRRVSMP